MEVTESLARVRRYTWWALLPFPPLLGAVTVAVLIIAGPQPGPVMVVLVALAAVVTATGAYLLHRSLAAAEPVRPTDPAVWVCAGALVFGIGLGTATGGAAIEWSALVALVAGIVAILLPKGRRSWALVGGSAAFGLVALAVAGPLGAVAGAVPVLFGGWGIWQTWWYYEVARQLDHARVQAAELAVANERLRFAAELHDIQGHHLQVIALRSELAARQATEQPDAAGAIMREVQELAREALRETRSLVGAYRQVSLGTEIANATRVLGAADVDTRPRLAADPDRLGDHGRLLGLVVREATTNILRHAAARHAQIELDTVGDRIRLLVRNDGADRGAGTGTGGGLAGLAERLSAVGGTLQWVCQSREFTVTATVPDPGNSS